MIEDGEENVDDYLIKYKSIAHNLFSIFKIKNSRNNCGQLKRGWFKTIKKIIFFGSF